MNPCDNTEMLLRMLSAPRRNNYFYGKRMDVPHFRMEQDYGKNKQWLLNRLALGKGVLCGLKVSLDGDRICVDPGVAIDGLGREIIVPVRACIDPATGDGGCCQPCCGPEDPVLKPVDPKPGLVAVNTNDAEKPAKAAEPAAVEPAAADTAKRAQAAKRGEASKRGMVLPKFNPPTQSAVAPAPAEPTDPGTPVPIPPRDTPSARGLFTLWACYKECKADYQPVNVGDCGSRQHCEAGTIVESFCLKITPGVAPLQGDPDWCANLWGAHDDDPKVDPKTPIPSGPGDKVPVYPGRPGGMTPATPYPAQPGGGMVHSSHSFVLDENQQSYVDATAHKMPTQEEMEAALESRRHILCELFDGTCEPSQCDPCVPLALLRISDGKVTKFDSCIVRPRIYSNARLLDMILCLAEKIDECCGHHDPVPGTAMKVASVDFLGGANLDVIASVASPVATTNVPISKQGMAIRVKFTTPFATGAQKPDTPGSGAPDWKKFNVLVAPEPMMATGPFFVPGKIVVEGTDTIRFDLSPLQPFYSGQHKGWQKGRLSMTIYGDDDSSAGRLAVTDTAGVALDGEPIALTAGVISGDGTKGGNFKFTFEIG